MRTAPDIIFSRQTDGSRDYISDRFYEYTGAELESAKGFGWLDFVQEDDREKTMALWTHSVKSGENYEAEYRIRGRDGQYRWFTERERDPIRDLEGQIVKWYGTCSDIHDSKILEQSIRDSATELERLVDDRDSGTVTAVRSSAYHAR